MQLSINKDKNKNKIVFFFFNTKLAMIFFFWIEVRAFTVAVLKVLAFSTSKNYFIYFTTSFYDTLNIKCSIFFLLSLHLK